MKKLTFLATLAIAIFLTANSASALTMIPVIWEESIWQTQGREAYYQQHLDGTLMSPVQLTDEYLTNGNGTSVGVVIQATEEELTGVALFSNSIAVTGWGTGYIHNNADWSTHFVPYGGYMYSFYDIDFTSLISSIERTDFSLITENAAAFAYIDRNPQDIYNSTAPVPEPATMLLFGSGLIGLAAVGKKRRRKS